MFKYSWLIIIFNLGHQLVFSSEGTNKMTPEQYIQKYREDALIEMDRFNIPASITLAQAMLESSYGNSELAIKANNHFGIKCHTSWEGERFIKDDDKRDECFRKYNSVLESYNDHSTFLTKYTRYAFLFELDRTDYKAWARGLKKAGYATNPKYADILIGLIETHQLYKFDRPKQQRLVIDTHEKPRTKESPSTTVSSKKVREIKRIGIKKYIIIKDGDSIEKIAKETDKDQWQLYKYNDLKKGEALTAGQKLFLQPKRNKAKEPYHVVKEGETMRVISQHYGIKLKTLYKKNNMEEGNEPEVGDQLYLRKMKPTNPLEDNDF